MREGVSGSGENICKVPEVCEEGYAGGRHSTLAEQGAMTLVWRDWQRSDYGELRGP